jgi:hypothetical protein
LNQFQFFLKSFDLIIITTTTIIIFLKTQPSKTIFPNPSHRVLGFFVFSHPVEVTFARGKIGKK